MAVGVREVVGRKRRVGEREEVLLLEREQPGSLTTRQG
jgi:hypothetical protein